MKPVAGIKQLLHRNVWQRLPYKLRRRLIFITSSSFAPKPPTHIDPALPLIVVGPLQTASGLGQSARLCYQALHQSGVNVLAIDLTDLLMQPNDGPSFDWRDGSEYSGPATLIIHVNGPFLPLAMMKLRPIVQNKFIVGYWAWELPEMPDEWAFGIPFVHEIWTPSKFVARAAGKLAANKLVRVLPHPVAVQPLALRKASPKSSFNVLSIFNASSSIERKNPISAINAFEQAFGDDADAHLTIKATGLSMFPREARVIYDAVDRLSNVTLIDRILSPEELADLYQNAEVFLSLHRAEGFGLALAEAMTHSLPVIATNWSGNTDFITSRTGIPIPYILVPASDSQHTYHQPMTQWAEADVSAAAAALIRLRADPDLRFRLGNAARSFAALHWTDNAYSSQVSRFLGLCIVSNSPKSRSS